MCVCVCVRAARIIFINFSCDLVIGCLLDLWEGKLSFYINGVPAGAAFEGLLGKDLYPMIRDARVTL